MACVFSETEQLSSQYVSAQSMQAYAQTLIDEYIQESNQYYPSRPSNLTFYPNTSYNITFYSSSQYGAALRFEQSSIPSFQTINTSERIEIAVFGGDYNLGGLVDLDNSNDIMFVGVSLINWGNRSVLRLVNENTSAIFEKLSVNRTSSYQFYHLVIIKGSNQTSEWTPELAKSEASGILYEDTGQSFPQSAEFIRLYGVSVLTQLLQAIQNKLSDKNYNYSLSEYLADLQNVKNVARQYGIATEYLNEIIGFLNAKITGILPTFPPEPTPKVTSSNDLYNWGYAILFGSYPVMIYSAFLFLRYINKKYESEEWRFLTHDVLLQGIFIGIGMVVLALDFPYDSPYLVLQIITVVIIAIVGILIVNKVRRKLSAWRFARANNSKSTNKKPQNKVNETPKTNKE